MDRYLKDYIQADRRRGGGKLLFLNILRRAHFAHNLITRLFYRVLLLYFEKFYGLEIPYTTSIGKGLYIGHAYNITINPHTIIGNNVNIHRGCLLGQQNRGNKKGAPIIGDKVWIGINAAIVGRVKIGNDVLIAPNTFVNCDVPSHSVVFGNPCIIKNKDNATESYINNVVD